MADSELRRVVLDRLYPPPERDKTRTGRLQEPHASLAHVKSVVKGPCKVIGPEGRPLMIVAKLGNTSRLAEALNDLTFHTAGRTSGMNSRSRTFGYAPRLPLRGHEACRRARLAQDSPNTNALLESTAHTVASLFERELPDEYYAHLEEARAKVHEAWRIGNTPFTSGIVNMNNPLVYHRDKGNFPNRWSVMVSLRSKCRGGALVFPELGIAHECNNGLAFIFEGQRWWHGVSPMVVQPGGYRLTVVYYSLKAMWQCLAPEDEIREARKRRTMRQRKRRDKKVESSK